MADGSDVTFLPLLRARFDDARVSEFLENAARAGTTVFVPLEAPPRDASLHRFEVHFPGRAPLVLLAEPLGAPRVEGFPLRLAFPTPSLTPPPRSVRPARSVPPAPGDSWVELPELAGAAAETPSIETSNVAFASTSDWLDEDQLNGPGSGRSHPSLKLELGDAPRAGVQETVAPEGVAAPGASAGTGPHAPFAPPAARPTPSPFSAPASGAHARSALTPLSPPTPYAAFTPPGATNTASSVMGGLAASAAAAAGVVGGLAASAAAAAAGLIASASGNSHANAQGPGAHGLAGMAEAPAGADPRSTAPITDEARTLAQFLSLLAETRDVARFTALVTPLEARVRALVDQGDAATARRIHSTLEMIVHEATRANEPRAPLAEQAIRVFSSSRLLAVLAPPVMKGQDPTGDAARILVNAGNKGAHALYSARVANDAPEARERFVALLGEIGPRALPTVANALERLAPRLTIPGAKSLAEDVLAVVPAVALGAEKRSSPPPAATVTGATGATPGLPELGAIVARFAQGEDAELALLATRALPRALRDGARPILFEQLHRPHDAVASAALAGLVAIGAVDELLFGELRAVVLGAVPSSPAFRLAATNAMASATPEVRPYAIALLEHAVATPALGAAQPAPAAPHGASDEEAFVLAAASALVTAGGNTDVIVQRWMASNGALRARLEPIVRRVM